MGDIISTIKHFFHEFITFKYRKSYLLGNNSKSEILLFDIKDYAIIPLGSLDYSSNAFINITSLWRRSCTLSTFILVFWTSRSLHLNNSSIWDHLYTVGLETDTRAYFTGVTILISFPTGTKIFN